MPEPPPVGRDAFCLRLQSSEPAPPPPPDKQPPADELPQPPCLSVAVYLGEGQTFSAKCGAYG